MLEIYANGVLHCSVCTDIEDRDEIERQVNAKNPSGVTLWKISEAPTFKGGEPNPCQCGDSPNRKHYLMAC